MRNDKACNDINIFTLRKKFHEFALRIRSEEVDPFGYDPIFNEFFTPLFEFLYTKYWRVETHGMENIPSEGPVLIVGNHSGCLPYDAAMLKIAIAKEHSERRDARFLVEDFIYHFPFLGSIINRFGGVRACPENAKLALDAKQLLVVFPEGVKGLGKLHSERYRLARFGRGGFVKLCLKTRAPMVPVAFVGPEDIHPMIAKGHFISQIVGTPYFPITWTFPWLGPLGTIPLPSKWSIHILPAISFSNYGPGAEKDRVLVNKMSNHVKEMIQDTLYDKIRKRRGVWF